MKKIIVLFYIFLYSFILADGPYTVNTITEQDGLRNGPDYAGGIVYYPESANGSLPIIVMVPGFSSFISSIEDWGPYLASYGIVTMFVNVNNIFFDPYARSQALQDGLISIKLENERIGSPLLGNLNVDNVSVGGWSMGGGGAQLASHEDSSIKAVIALSPWLSNGNVTLNNNIPIIFFSGEFDGVASNDFHTNVFYNYTPESTDKLLFEISGGSHSTVCSPYNNEIMGLKALYWIERYINDNNENCNSLIQQPLSASSFTTNIECIEQLIGDVNNDGILNVIDVVSIVDIILYDSYLESADVNLDGNVNILDAIQLVNIILS